ncbi:unnamed protein product [Danaus chrysippus]|uniref:(African queen) hypothetical protein n=1 Tax=Danaus chrysippus TaxID=151541 RepID=A0A8J2R9E3_9NEOP|nr:unnamed protein product [Danaus chrysippus]
MFVGHLYLCIAFRRPANGHAVAGVEAAHYKPVARRASRGRSPVANRQSPFLLLRQSFPVILQLRVARNIPRSTLGEKMFCAS